MVFKSLEKYFEKKKKVVLKNSDTNIEIQRAVMEFINKSFQNSEIYSLISVEYKNTEKIITIICPNKILSSEIALRISNLQKILIERKLIGIKVIIK